MTVSPTARLNVFTVHQSFVQRPMDACGMWQVGVCIASLMPPKSTPAPSSFVSSVVKRHILGEDARLKLTALTVAGCGWEGGTPRTHGP